jgi:hypothetical protein
MQAKNKFSNPTSKAMDLINEHWHQINIMPKSGIYNYRNDYTHN